MQTLSSLPPAKQKRIALETDEIYASLAYRLGMHNVSGDCRTSRSPISIRANTNGSFRRQRTLCRTEKYLEKIKPQIKKVLEEHDINPLDIEIRAVGYTVCVRPWGGDGFCGTVKSFSVPSVLIQVTKIVGCENGCPAKPECSASKPVGGADGLQEGDQIAVPSWCGSPRWG